MTASLGMPGGGRKTSRLRGRRQGIAPAAVRTSVKEKTLTSGPSRRLSRSRYSDQEKSSRREGKNSPRTYFGKELLRVVAQLLLTVLVVPLPRLVLVKV